MATTTTTTTQPVDYTTKRRIELAQEQLNAIDLRSLRGEARTDVKDARAAVATALRSVRASA